MNPTGLRTFPYISSMEDMQQKCHRYNICYYNTLVAIILRIG